VKSLIALAAVAAFGAVAAPAFAQTLPVLGQVTYSASIGYADITTLGADLGAVNLRAGADFGKYLGVEAEGAFGVNQPYGDQALAATQLHLNNQYAAYGVARLPVLDAANLFVRVGYGHTDLRVTSLTASVNNGLDSWNYGVGAEYFLDGKNGVRVDLTRSDFMGRNLQIANTWSLGYIRRF
jgi:outer membrane immunogenic protein